MLYAVDASCLYVLGLSALYTRQCIVCTTNYMGHTSLDSVQPAALFDCVGTSMSKP